MKAKSITLAIAEGVILTANTLLVKLFWQRRREVPFLVRSPLLTIMGSQSAAAIFASFVVITILEWEGFRIPGRVLLYVPYLGAPLVLASFVLKAAKFLTIGSEEFRQRFPFILRPRTICYVLFWGEVFFLAVAVLLDSLNWNHCYREGDDQGNCIYWVEWQVWLPLMAPFLIPSAFLVQRLLKKRDKFYVYIEHIAFLVVLLIELVLYEALNAAVVQRGLLAAPRNMHYSITPFILQLQFMSLSMPWLVQWWEQVFRKQKVAPSEMCVAWENRWKSSSVILDNPEMAKLFGKVVERNLCWESLEFVQLANAYKAAAPQQTAAENHLDLRGILHEFVASGAPFEINIASSMAKKVLKNLDEHVFMELTKEEQASVLDEPRKESKPMVQEVVKVAWLVSRKRRLEQRKKNGSAATDYPIIPIIASHRLSQGMLT
ncbi:unnamed protein product [Chrysoparadoxa australica]